MNAHAKATNEDCDEIHDDYFERRSIPRIRLIVLGILATGLSSAAVVLFFIISSKITEHELKDTSTLVNRREFESTVQRIERKIDSLDTTVSDSLSEVSGKLDRNLAMIKGNRS